MDVRMRVRGVPETMARLRYTAEIVPEKGRKAMHRAADKIVQEAKLNAPVDTHNLEESIRKVVSYGFRGRLKIDIEMGGYVNGVDVSVYALQVHENYESMMPGHGTIMKRIANPNRHVGGKFLTRALKKVQPTIEPSIFEAIASDITRTL